MSVDLAKSTSEFNTEDLLLVVQCTNIGGKE